MPDPAQPMTKKSRKVSLSRPSRHAPCLSAPDSAPMEAVVTSDPANSQVSASSAPHALRAAGASSCENVIVDNVVSLETMATVTGPAVPARPPVTPASSQSAAQPAASRQHRRRLDFPQPSSTSGSHPFTDSIGRWSHSSRKVGPAFISP